ncbi:hypothetical protein ACH5RR_036627 [Cinchona calisaya]|uniref:RNase H type-1 domain-containing protein n=1 Tax=Cinchona calisaya TaxID=153742 RepID=A0ABD2Y519_9GENT
MAWKADLVQHLFWIVEANAILVIPLSKNHFRYTWVWHYAKNGQFLVKSAHKVARNTDAFRLNGLDGGSGSFGSDLIWKRIWEVLRSLSDEDAGKFGALAWGILTSRNAKVFEDSAYSGAGVIICDCSRKFIAGCTDKFVDVVSPELAKMLAARRAVEFAPEVGVSRFWLEGDSQCVINLLNSDKEDRSHLGPIVDDVKIGIFQLQAHNVCWVDRDTKKLAHSFASWQSCMMVQ